MLLTTAKDAINLDPEYLDILDGPLKLYWLEVRTEIEAREELDGADQEDCRLHEDGLAPDHSTDRHSVLVVGLIYDGAVFYSRWDRDQRAKRAQAEREAENARKEIDSIGRGRPENHRLLRWPGGNAAGGPGARTVRIEPSIGETRPR